MSINIIERAVTPYNVPSSKIVQNEQYGLFAPMANVNKVGMAGYNPQHFSINDKQIVSLSTTIQETMKGVQLYVGTLDVAAPDILDTPISLVPLKIYDNQRDITLGDFVLVEYTHANTEGQRLLMYSVISFVNKEEHNTTIAPLYFADGIQGLDGIWYGDITPPEEYKVWVSPGGSRFILTEEEHDAIVNSVLDDKVIANIISTAESGGYNGKSAYQMALDSGFSGTEEEWLESLQGETPYIGANNHWWIGDTDTGANTLTDEELAELQEKADNAISLAQQANSAKGFATYQSLVAELNSAPADKWSVGQSFLIITLNVPDLWISAIEETFVSYTYVSDKRITNILDEDGYIQIGYYKVSPLETLKQDLTNYVQKTDNATSISSGIVRPNLTYGTKMVDDVYIAIQEANDAEINAKIDAYKPLTPRGIDIIVKAGLVNNGETLTDEEKAAIKNWLGIESTASGGDALMPKETVEWYFDVSLDPNKFVEITGVPDSTTNICLNAPVDGYFNEWIFTITMGDTAYPIEFIQSFNNENDGSVSIEWSLGIGPTFLANTTTEVRLHCNGDIWRGVWL